MKEEWRQSIVERYEVSDKGRVRHTATKRVRKPVNSKGYWGLTFRVNGKICHRMIHKMVAKAFLPPYDSDKEINHIDGNKRNNCVSNLETVTHAENIAHASRTGLLQRQERHELLESDTPQGAFGIKVRAARLAKGWTRAIMARRFHVTTLTVSNWERGKNKPQIRLRHKIERLLGEDMKEFVIAIDAIGPCWVDTSVDGDPGRTTRLKSASRWTLESEARANMLSIQRCYPRRKCQVIELSHYELK